MTDGQGDKNARVLGSDSQPPWPVPPEYVTPWSVQRLAELMGAIPEDDYRKGLTKLLLQVVREADQLLSKAQFDIWTLEGLLRDKNDAS